MMVRLLSVLLALFAATALAGCETVKGVGRDITKAGQALDDAFDD